MNASSLWKVGLGLIGAAGILATSGTGCGSGTSSTTGDTTSTSSSGGTGGSTSGTGGNPATTGSTTTATGTSTGAGTSTSTATGTSTGTGMMSSYVDCGACTDLSAGAPANECKTAYSACEADANCIELYNCAYDLNTGCPTDASGACCTFDCYNQLKAKLANDPNGAALAQKAIDEYHAYDDCLYCTTCKDQCSADAYCTAYAAGPAACQ
jgi:hypothetical protein